MERRAAMVQPAKRMCDIAVADAQKVRSRPVPTAAAEHERFGRSPRLLTELLVREGIA